MAVADAQVEFREIGRIGTVTLLFDRITSRYIDPREPRVIPTRSEGSVGALLLPIRPGEEKDEGQRSHPPPQMALLTLAMTALTVSMTLLCAFAGSLRAANASVKAIDRFLEPPNDPLGAMSGSFRAVDGACHPDREGGTWAEGRRAACGSRHTTRQQANDAAPSVPTAHRSRSHVS